MSDQIISNFKVTDFLYEKGLLFAINRTVLNPLGLTLLVGSESNEPVISLIRHEDPSTASYTKKELLQGAILYDSYLTEEGGNDQSAIRLEKLGYVIQPIPIIGGVQEIPVNYRKTEISLPAEISVSTEPEKISEEPVKERKSKGGAADRKDLISETPSFSSRISSLVSEGTPIDEIRDEDSPIRKIDISKYKVINPTKLTSSCSHPPEYINKENISGGGSILFCSACGAQFSDSDLIGD